MEIPTFLDRSASHDRVACALAGTSSSKVTFMVTPYGPKGPGLYDLVVITENVAVVPSPAGQRTTAESAGLRYYCIHPEESIVVEN